MQTKVMTGSRSVATAITLAKPEVIAAYPITPQTEIVEDIATFIAEKRLSSRFIKVDSEHSAMGACIGASSAGARTFTATSSQGLLYMDEVVHWASHARLPIVMAVATRALASPWSILDEHTDFMTQLASGWIQIMAENNQDAFDSTLQAYRIGEDPRVTLPVMVGLDGFILTHASMPVDMPEEAEIEGFLGKRKPEFALDVDRPFTFGNVVDHDYFMEMRHEMFEAMQAAKGVMAEVAKEYKAITGKEYGMLDAYNCDGAEHIIVAIGASSGDAKVASDELRKKGVKAGVIRIRVLRPFPKEEIAEALGSAETVTVVERALSVGSGNILAHEIRSALYDTLGSEDAPTVKGFVAGLGGRDITPDDYVQMVSITEKRPTGDEWFGLGNGR